MMLRHFIFLSWGIISIALAKSDITVVHYNIKELTSSKLRSPNTQLYHVKKVLNSMDFDILSVQEMQYDLPGIPDRSFTSKGKNMEILLNFLGLQREHFYISFSPANTGKKAKRKKNGNYYSDAKDPIARTFADPFNFGLFPGQYSSALVSRFPRKKKKELVITHLPWRQFNPNINLDAFKTSFGHSLPKDIQLFDKNFTDLTVSIAGKEVHIISLHAVPSFGFGNKLTSNFKRNEDQLRFLEWYLTGHTDIEVSLPHIKSIAGKPFIAVGDWNIDPSSPYPGSTVLNRLFSKANIWMNPPDRTYEGPTFAPGAMKKTFDYIAFSNHFELISSGIYGNNDRRIEFGPQKPSLPTQTQDQEIVTYQKDEQIHYVSVDRDYANAKAASDHFPLFIKLRPTW